MNMPGFTAELSLMRKSKYYGRFTTHSMAIPGVIQPALINVPRVICYCAEWDVVEKGGGGVIDWFGELVESCVQLECVMVPIFYDL